MYAHRALVNNAIVELVTEFRYRPVTEERRNEMLALYKSHLNGFDLMPHRQLQIGGVTIAKAFERVVVGDYGAFVEIDPANMLVELTVPENQKWRLNKKYVEEKKLSVKYEWYEYCDVKIYKQLATVKYADYKPGMYYVSVLDFDELVGE